MKKRRRQEHTEGDLFSPLPRAGIAPAEGSQTPDLDEHFARLVVRLDGRAGTALESAAKQLSAHRSSGHVCIPISTLLEEHPEITEILTSSPVVGGPGDWKPMILDSGRLYLQRYWEYERQLADAIVARSHEIGAAALIAEDQALAIAILGTDAADQQRAVKTALTRQFSIVTGGPGTGKTRTAAAILVVAQQQAARSGNPLRVTMAAPTGKAAARLTDSLRTTLQSISAPASLHELRAITLHRLLGTRPDAPSPRVHATHPLATDLVIVDEASMIDLATMAKLIQAVPTTARLILLGDRDQLASIDAGHLLGDLCAAAERGALPGALVELRRTFRFATGSGIAEFSSRLKAGESSAAIGTLQGNASRDLVSVELPSASQLGSALRIKVIEGFRALVTAPTPEVAVNALGQFCILAAVRRGPFGVETVNRVAELILQREGLIEPGLSQYAHRPIMILSNDYNLYLFNGDIGVIMPDPESRGDLRAFFHGTDGVLRKFIPARLPAHETVWAMTIHKSQGSEYERILVVLPDRDGPTLNRELVYTAVSRARSYAEIWYRPDVLRTALERTVNRTSGLPDALVRGAAGNGLGSLPLGS